MAEQPDHPLPLTEHGEAALSPDEQLIRRLVDSFYGSIRADPALGPIFAAHVRDWPAHLGKMYDFWSSMVLRSGRYSGRPIMEHMKIGGLTRDHFARWLELWHATVHEHAPPRAQPAFINAAERMASAMMAQVIGRGGS